MNISRFQNPPPLFRGEDCPVIWEWTISDRSASPSAACTVACTQLEHETADDADQLDNGDNSPIRGDVAGAEESDSGSEEVFGGFVNAVTSRWIGEPDLCVIV